MKFQDTSGDTLRDDLEIQRNACDGLDYVTIV